jgi:hypothetical protein
MRFGMLVLALVALTACKKGKAPEPAGPVDDGSFSPGFVDITFADGDEDLEELMGSELMQSKAVCSNLTKLEPAAMMGKLSDPEIGCLEDALRDADRQTYKRKISLLLMSDAWAKGDHQRWEAIVARHLEQIDRSDPDLCYKYALYLSKKGPKYTSDSIRWADAALENRTMWKGETHVARVYSLYRLKARAAQIQWEYWEEKYLSEPTEEVEKSRDDARNQTKTLSREWLDYARSSGKDATVALQLCEAAAGTRQYCSAE